MLTFFTVLLTKKKRKFRLNEDGLTVTSGSVQRAVVSQRGESAAKSGTTVQDGVSTFEEVSCETTGYFWIFFKRASVNKARYF